MYFRLVIVLSYSVYALDLSSLALEGCTCKQHTSRQGQLVFDYCIMCSNIFCCVNFLSVVQLPYFLAT